MMTAHTIRRTTVTLAATVLIMLPLVSSATATSVQEGNASLLNAEWSPEVSNQPEAVYGKLKAKSRNVCGSSDLRITGGLTQSRKIEECYEGTLTAAVNRLDNPEVTALHFE